MILGLGNEKSSANGIYNIGTISTSTIENIINHRIIAGKSSGGDLSGNGIVNYDNNKGSATIKNIINSNIISGSGSGTLSGNGILNYNSVIENIANSGMILGTSSSTIENKSGNGIVNFNATINNVENYGIIAGSNKAVDSDSGIKSQENFGLLIDGAGTSSQKITAGAGGEHKIPVFNDDGSQTTETKFIINGADKTGEGANAVALNSSDLKDKVTEKYFTENKYQNLIINVAGDNNNSLNIDSDFNISQSTINGYKNAVALNGGAFIGTDITINAGDNAFLGSSSNDNINLSNGSTVNGNIDLGEGEDKISFDTSVLNGNITGNNDTIIFDKSQLNGNITSSEGKIIISGGENTLFNTGSSVINGNITLTDGEIFIGEGTQINGKIELTGDNAVIWLSENQKINENITVSATEKILGLNYNINNSGDLNSVKEQLNGNGFAGIYLTDGGNTNVDLREIKNISKINGGNGDDRFIISANELKNNLDSLNGGADENKNPYNDNDILELTTEVNNTSDFILFKNVENVETLKLADIEGNRLDINNISTSNVDTLRFKNYIGGDKDDNFNVSVDNFQKLSLIDGGANGTDKGDTLTINKNPNDSYSSSVTNIGENSNFDFDKIQNIENLTFDSDVKADLDLNNLSDDYLKNLEIKLGNHFDIISISTDKLQNLKGLNGSGDNIDDYDTLQITNEITDKDEKFSFLVKEDGTNKINSFEAIEFSGKNNFINLDNLAKANNEIEFIYGGSGDDYFITSKDLLLNTDTRKQIYGQGGIDTIEITSTVNENDSVFKFVNRMEKLVLSGENNKIIVDKLIKYNGENSFTEVTGTNGGAEGNTFTINGTDEKKKDKALGMTIKGGSSVNDKLIVNTDISKEQLLNKTGIENLKLGLNKEIDYNIDFTQLKDFKNITSGNGNDTFTVSTDNIGSMTIDGGGNHQVDGVAGQDSLKLSGALNNDTEDDTKENKNILNGVSNIENLYLDNEKNILNLDKVTSGFKNISGGTGNDTFKISAENLEKLTLLDGGANTDNNTNDTLEITLGDIKDNSLEKVKNIESLTLAENSTSNNLDLDNLSFKNISGGNGSDTFKISADKLGNFDKVVGNGGEDTLEIKTALNNSNEEKLGNYTEIENLKLNASGNDFILDEKNAGENNFTTIEFEKNSTGNTITLAENLGAKNITFDTFAKDNTVNVDTVEVEGIKIFAHTITNAGSINLTGDKSEWKFANDTIRGNSDLNLGKNILNLLNNEQSIKDDIPTDKIINSGNVGLDNGKLVFGDVNFVGNGNKVTISNGTIKIGFDESVKNLTAGQSYEILGGEELTLGNNLTFDTYEFLSTNGTTIKVKEWSDFFQDKNDDRLVYNQNYIDALGKYNTAGNNALTNAFNTFTSDGIVDYISNKTNPKLLYYSDRDRYQTLVAEKDETVLIKTSDTDANKNTNLTFAEVSTTGEIKIVVTEGKNSITFGESGKNVTIAGTGINGIDSTTDLTININGDTNSISNINGVKENSNIININGTTSVENIVLGNKDDLLDIKGTGDKILSSIDLGAGNDEIKISDVSKIKGFTFAENSVKEGNDIISIVNGNDTDGFNVVLAGANENIDEINVQSEKNNLDIKNDYSGELNFENGKNEIKLLSEYSGNINFAKGENTFTLSNKFKGENIFFAEGNNTVNILENGFIDGDKLSLVGDNNSLNITSGTLENGITFGENSSNNQVIVGENGTVGKDIIFGKGTGDVFSLNSKTGDFDYNITNADTINLNGENKKWKFSSTSTIKGDNVTVNLNDNGEIGFNIGKSDTGLVLGKGGVNPFAETGKYTINGNIKLTFDDTITFLSLSDTLKVDTNIFASDKTKIDAPEFLNYNGSEFSIKSAEELKDFGLKDYAFGNYEHAILNYNKEGYGSITTMLNNNNLTQISSILNKGIDEKDYYFYSDDREIKDMATIGDIYIKTSEDNKVTDKDTDIKFTNVTGNIANISFAQGTTNTVSFLEGTNLSKIDGSSSKAGFTLNLNGVNFEKPQDEKDNTKVVMSDYEDILNIQSSLNNIGIDTGKGNDTINISSSVNNLTLNTGLGDDTINILSSVNGIFDGNEGTNTLNIGEKTQTLSEEKPKNEIVLSGTIKNFQDINLNENTKLNSKLVINGTNSITIAKDKVLNLGINLEDKDSNGKIKGHALYDKGITVNNNEGSIMVEVAEISQDILISLGNNNASTITNEDNLLISGSTNHDIAYDKENDDIKVTVKEHFIGKDEMVKYGHLDKIYQSIVSADKIGLMAQSSTLKDKTKEEAIKAQLEFYGKIYHSTPYAYTHKISKKSAELITDSLMLNEGMPELKSWRFGGSIAGREVENSENFYGNNYYNGIDVGNTEVKAETNIYGAYAFGEYGFEEGKAVGFAVAGSKSDTDINGSSLKGNNIFVSAYIKQNINNLNMIAGIGYQRGFYEADRNVSNAYQSMKVEKDFDDDLVVGYLGARYRYDLGNDFYLEPNGELRITHSIQDDIKEADNKDLSMEVEDKNFTSLDGELGLNLGKKIAVENGSFNLKAGVSVSYAFKGAEEEELDARITGATKGFEIVSPEEDKTKVNVLLKGEYQMNNGVFYDVHYKTTTDGDDYTIGAGIGYRF